MNPLQQGSKGAEVAKLQTSLKSAGFDPGNIDSDFGPKTAAALSAYQTSKGLKADSVFGPITSGALYGTQAGTNTGLVTSSGGKSPLELSQSLSEKPAYDIATGRLTEYGKSKGLPEVNPDPNGPGVGTSTAARATEIQKIKDEMNAGLTEPATYKSLDEFTKLRNEQGVVKDEEELNTVRNEAAQIQQTLREFASTAGEGTSEAGRIGAVSEAERNAQFRLDSLNLRETAVTNRLATKNSYINTVLGLGKDDYNTAYTKYTNEYNKNVKAVDLYNAKLNEQQKDALTGFTTITNLLKDHDISKIDSATSATLDTLALQAGLPKGIFQSVIQATPDEKILSPVMVDTDNGKDIYFYTQGKDGKPSLKTVQHLPGSGKGDGSGGRNVKLTTANRTKLLGAGFSSSDVVNIEKDISAHGFDAALAGVKDEKQKNALKDVYGVAKTVNKAQLTSTVTQKMAQDALKENYTEDELKAFADEAGKSSFWTGKKSDIDRWLNSPEAKAKYVDILYNQYKDAGMAD